MDTRFAILLSAGLLAPAGPPRAGAEGEGQRRAAEAIEDLGGKVGLQSPAGRDPFLRVFWHSGKPADGDLAHLKALPGLAELILDCPKVTDAGLAHLKGLAGLREVRLYGRGFTDKGVAHLKGLAGLRTLYLKNDRITDAGLAHLKGLAALEKLVVVSPNVTDAGLLHLKGLKRLKELDLGLRSKVTADGVKELQKSLPDVTVGR